MLTQTTNNNTITRRTAALVLCALLLPADGAVAQDVPTKTIELDLGGGTSVTVEKYGPASDRLLVWLPTELGVRPGEARVAKYLGGAGIEVWRADLLEANFLPPLASSIEQVADSQIATLLDAARRRHKRVMVMSAARGAVLALRGVHAWQTAHPGKQGVSGVILLHPNLYQAPDAPGAQAGHLPVVTGTNVPIYILQPQRSPWAWRLPGLARDLQTGGARVYTQFLEGVRDRFYFRTDATDIEAAAAQDLGRHIQRAYGLLAHHETPRTAASGSAAAPRIGARTVNKGLAAYAGDPEPPPLQLVTLAGPELDLRELRGRVVLVNFWASWCPPCVHEMPSMERLYQSLLERPFTIVAVNLGETAAEITEFVQNKARVSFPIVLDRRLEATRAWRVFAYPTSYLIDRDGRIRFGAFGELSWDDPEVTDVINELLTEKP